MENWDLRHDQVRSIVGTNDPRQLSEAAAAARDHMAHQPSASNGGVPWEFVGPAAVTGQPGQTMVAGRITALAIDPSDPRRLYVGSAAGGVFRSTDGGDTWQPRWWRSQRSLAVGGVGLCARHPEVVYAATGEWDGRVSSTTYHHFPGDGVQVSQDGGESWLACNPLSTSDRRASRWTNAVAVHPIDSRCVFVAGDRALHRSLDGGTSWEEVLLPNQADSDGLLPGDMVVVGAVTDVAIDPDTPGVVYAAAHKTGVFKSDAGGRADSFRPLALPGLDGAQCEAPKIALGARSGAGGRFVVVVTAGRVFASDDGGTMFRLVGQPIKDGAAGSPTIPPYFAWCTAIGVHPRRPGLILAGHVNLWRTLDGGQTPWESHSVQPLVTGLTHTDVQAIAFDPANPDRVYVATDGGVYRTHDVGAPRPTVGGIWEERNLGLAVTQCYTVSVASSRPFRVGVTTQDLGAYVYLGGHDPGLDPARKWKSVHNYEGGWIEFEPTSPPAVLLDTRAGRAELDDPDTNCLRRSGDDGNSWTIPRFPGPGGTPFQSDATIHEALAIASRQPLHRLLIARLASPPNSPVQIYQTADAGARWESITDVTDPVAVEISADGQLAYAANTTGLLWMRAGGRWRRLQLDRPLPVQPINDIEISPVDARIVYVAIGGADAKGGVSQGAIFPADVAAVWRIVVADDDHATAAPAAGSGEGALPPRLPVTGLEIDPGNPDHLYASHLAGLHRSTDGGGTWSPLVEGLPATFVSDLDLHVDGPSRTLYAATMGRGVFRLPLAV